MKDTVSIHQAISEGIRTVKMPARIIMYSGTAACALLVILSFSWWYLLLIPAGLFASYLYEMFKRPGWQIRAYRAVGDIHQLQRSAELAGILPKRSHERTTGFTNHRQQEMLAVLRQRFSEDPAFIDDPTIPAESPVYSGSFIASRKPLMTLNNEGIVTFDGQLLTWDKIANDRIATETCNRYDPATAIEVAAGAKEYFRFEYPGLQFEIEIADIKTPAWELDLLVYLYRGRYYCRMGAGLSH